MLPKQKLPLLRLMVGDEFPLRRSNQPGAHQQIEDVFFIAEKRHGDGVPLVVASWLQPGLCM